MIRVSIKHKGFSSYDYPEMPEFLDTLGWEHKGDRIGDVGLGWQYSNSGFGGYCPIGVRCWVTLGSKSVRRITKLDNSNQLDEGALLRKVKELQAILDEAKPALAQAEAERAARREREKAMLVGLPNVYAWERGEAWEVRIERVSHFEAMAICDFIRKLRGVTC